MPDITPSYAYANGIRDVSEIYNVLRVGKPRFMERIRRAVNRALSHKHEFINDKTAPQETSVGADALVGATSISVASATGIIAGTILHIPVTDEQVRVTAVSGSTLTITRGYGDTTAVALTAGSKVRIMNPNKEATKAGSTTAPRDPDLLWNQTQIFIRESQVSRTPNPAYGINTANSADPVGERLSRDTAINLDEILREQNYCLIHGRRVIRSSGVEGTMGGLKYFMQGGNVVNATGSALSTAHIKSAFRKCYDGGADRIDTLLCGSYQAAAITALYEDKIRVVATDTTGGSQILRVISPLPVNGFAGEIWVDSDVRETEIILLDSERCVSVPMRATIEPSRGSGDDFEAERIVIEETAEFHDAKNVFCLISNLAAS